MKQGRAKNRQRSTRALIRVLRPLLRAAPWPHPCISSVLSSCSQTIRPSDSTAHTLLNPHRCFVAPSRSCVIIYTAPQCVAASQTAHFSTLPFASLCQASLHRTATHHLHQQDKGKPVKYTLHMNPANHTSTVVHSPSPAMQRQQSQSAPANETPRTTAPTHPGLVKDIYHRDIYQPFNHEIKHPSLVKACPEQMCSLTPTPTCVSKATHPRQVCSERALEQPCGLQRQPVLCGEPLRQLRRMVTHTYTEDARVNEVSLEASVDQINLECEYC